MDKGEIASAMLSNALENITGEDRTQFLGGSDVAAVLGVDPFKTRLQLWEEKVGIGHAFAGNFHTRRGNRQEAVAADVFTEVTGRKLQRVNRRLVHPVYPFLTARIDRRIVGEQRVGEIKVPSFGAFARIKRVGLHEGYICQMQDYLALTGYEGGDWIIFCPDQDALLTFPMERDETFIGNMIAQLVAFWNENVVKRIPPSAVEKDEERVEIRKAEGIVETYHVADDAEFGVAMDMLRETRQLSAEAEQLGEEAREKLRAKIGDRFGVFLGDGFRLSYTQAKGRSSFDKAALAGTKPLDRLAVGAILNTYWESLRVEPSQVQYRFEEAVIKPVGAANLDLSQFEKLGKPYPIMKPTFYGEE